MLRPSDNFTVVGKIEKMMEILGCYIRYHYNLDGVKFNNTAPTFEEKNLESISACATECFLKMKTSKSKCTAWSFQMATERCLLFHQGHVNTTMLSPSKTMSSMQETAKNIGWASGTMACTYHLYFCYC